MRFRSSIDAGAPEPSSARATSLANRKCRVRVTHCIRVVALAVFAATAFTFATSALASAASNAKPSAPRDVRAVAGANSVTLHFLAPRTTGGRRVTRYDGLTRPGSRAFACSSTNCTVRGLTNGVSYSFSVAAVTSAGRGPYSSKSNAATPRVPGPSITFNANGGTGVMAKEVASAQGFTTLTSNAFSNGSLTFAGWNTAADGSGTGYADGGTYDFASNVTLYAQWSTGTITISFNANGGTGVMAPETEPYWDDAALSQNAFVYAGYTFAGWNSLANGTGVSFGNGQVVGFAFSATLYAQWTAVGSAGPFPGSTSTNWSGYVVQGQSGGYQGVSGQWTVPTLNCASASGGAMSVWVGVNGLLPTGPGLFQDGSSSQCDGSDETSFLWWTDSDEGYEAQYVLPVNTGDVIDASVTQSASGDWVYTVKDVSTGQTSSSPEPFTGEGTSAEWIVEDPTSESSQSLIALPNFGTVTVTNLGLVVPGTTWNLPPYDDAVNMVTSDGTVEASTSAIQGSGTTASFSVVYETSGP